MHKNINILNKCKIPFNEAKGSILEYLWLIKNLWNLLLKIRQQNLFKFWNITEDVTLYVEGRPLARRMLFRIPTYGNYFFKICHVRHLYWRCCSGGFIFDKLFYNTIKYSFIKKLLYLFLFNFADKKILNVKSKSEKTIL